jgi:hypothetical protein
VLIATVTMFSDGSDEAQVAASSSLEQAFITGAAAMDISIDGTIHEILQQPGSAESTATVSTVDNCHCCSCCCCSH